VRRKRGSTLGRVDLQRVPPGPWRLHVVPHTHWDREWYLPLETFRIRLAHTLDEVMDVLEADPGMCFTLDGQSVLLEDYAEYRPDGEHLRRLRKLVRSGRLAVGPAYQQPDELLVGGESLVRNFLVGAKVCRRFGAEPAPIGYSPDAFGHPAQMPQILRGFGLDHFIFSRGIGDEGEDAGAVMWWEGPDRSRVLAIHLSGTYASLSSLGREDGNHSFDEDPDHWPERAATRVGELLAQYGPDHRLNRLHDVLLCNGVDHRRIQRNLREMLDAATERIPGTSYTVGSYDEYVETLRSQLPELRLKTIRGELVGGRFHTVTRGVNSTRLELKQANHEVEQLLQSSETLAALAKLRSDYDFPLQAFELAWRRLMRAQPHDSIAGCSVDKVHRDQLQRFETARAIVDRLGQEALVALSGLGRDAIWHYAGEPGASRSLVNVLPWARRRPAELRLPEDLRRARSLVARTDSGDLPVQLLNAGGERRALVIPELPGFGSLPLELAPGRTDTADTARASGPRTIENALLRVSVAANGTLTVTDRAGGRRFAGLHLIEDQADRGDEYTFCPLEGETPRTSRDAEATVRVVERGPLRAELEVRVSLPLPAALSEDRRRRVGQATCLAITRVRLDAGVDRVELSTRLVNRACDHRLRVRFPDRAGDPDRIRAQSAFAVVERPARPSWNENWFEQPHLTSHTAGMVSAGELVLMTRGLPEYEAIPRRGGGVDLALTLLRAVGWLARSDLATRHVTAGPRILTPDAQGMGERTCEYALALRRGADDAELVRATEDYRFAAADAPGRVNLAGALEVSGRHFACSALKGAEDGDGVILRLYNPGRRKGFVAIGGEIGSVERCRLDESGGEPVSGRIPLGPYEIVTLRVRRAA
jgi:mannosylglycerate hydrolase